MQDSATVGGCALSGGGQADVLCVRLSAAGVCDWARSYGGAAAQRAEAVAIDANGAIVAGGWYAGTVDFGDGSFSSSDTDPFVLRLGSAGQLGYATGSGSEDALHPEEQRVYAVAGDDDGNAYAGGHFVERVEFGGGTLTSPAGSGPDGFLVKLGITGTHEWSHAIAGPSEQRVSGVAVDGAGNVVATGFFEECLDVDETGLSATGSKDLFLLKLDPDGHLLWAYGYGDEADPWGIGLAIDDGGNVWLVGHTAGSIDFGCGAASPPAGTGLLVAKLASDGSCLFSEVIGDSGYSSLHGVAVDASGNALVVGQFAGTIALGSQILVADGAADVVVAKLASNGTHLWAKRFGAAGQQIGHAIAADSDGNVVLSGEFADSIFFGGDTLNAGTTVNGFVAKLSP